MKESPAAQALSARHRAECGEQAGRLAAWRRDPDPIAGTFTYTSVHLIDILEWNKVSLLHSP